MFLHRITISINGAEQGVHLLDFSLLRQKSSMHYWLLKRKISTLKQNFHKFHYYLPPVKILV